MFKQPAGSTRWPGGGPRPRGRRSGGFSLVDVTVALFVVTIGIGGLSAAVVSSLNLGRANEGAALAHERARQIAETLTTTPFPTIFATFNGDDADDPGGPGTAPGNGFEVTGLSPRPDDPDGLPGVIVFPAFDADPGVLREDFQEVRLGMPRDLNADGLEDGLDHSADYVLLPVIVRVEWRGASGDASYDLPLLLAR